MATLLTLLKDVQYESVTGHFSDSPVTDIVSDSRKVSAGSIFVAVRGDTFDGHGFIHKAVENGALAIVGEEPSLPDISVPYLRVRNSRQSLAYLASAFYGHPARRLTMIGVTGTDGKTTTCNLLYQILLEAGMKAGMISTVNAVIGNEILDTGFHVTTPDALDVQRILAKMVDAGLTHVILETTSHGWAQFRVDACEFDIGVITNITHEHLDYHGSYENYRAAKARLFSSLSETKTKGTVTPRLGVLNRDDSSFEFLDAVTQVNQVSYGVHPESDFRAEGIQFNPSGLSFTVVHSGLRKELSSLLVGAFNVSNCLAAYSTAVAGLGIQPETAAKGISTLASVPGRMERIDMGQGFTAIVDFAHTPNALMSALKTASEITSGKVLAVYGSAGLRDRQKRVMMAQVASELADVSILTAEDPRTESLDDILEEMASGAISKGGVEGKTFWRVQDRGDAIRQAVNMASAGDLVIACGKGHEQSMCFGEIEYPWDDRAAMRSALAERLGLPSIVMPYLPTRSR